MSEEKVFSIINSEGKEVTAEILFTYHSDDFGKDYVVFKPSDSDQYTAAYYTPDCADGVLADIESDEEWEMLEDLMEDYFNEEEA